MAVRRSDAIFRHPTDNALGDRRKLWLRATRADHERLSHGGETAYVKDENIGGLLLFREKGDLSCKVVWLNGSLLFG